MAEKSAKIDAPPQSGKRLIGQHAGSSFFRGSCLPTSSVPNPSLDTCPRLLAVRTSTTRFYVRVTDNYQHQSIGVVDDECDGIRQMSTAFRRRREVIELVCKVETGASGSSGEEPEISRRSY